MKKKVLMVMPVLKGGGAERVATLLINEFHKEGYQAEFLLTSTLSAEVIRGDLNEDIPLIILQDQFKEKDRKESASQKINRWCVSLFSRLFEAVNMQVPASIAYQSFICQYRNEIKHLREYLKKNPEMTVVAFLQPSIPMAVLAAKGLPNKVIISERGDPKRLMKKRYGKAFIEKYYTDVNYAVFQTPEAMNAYPKLIADKGRVIFNPIKDNLPMPFTGERNKIISTFCRISRQKNLVMLVKAFEKLSKEFPEYRLRIIGDAINEDDKKIYNEIIELSKNLGIEDKLQMQPFSNKVHEEIVHDAMYVNSSDYEGMSNAMLEAMAIGMPVVCTDCPIGGAHAVIRDGDNGLLVPIGDDEAAYLAMKKIITNKDEVNKIAENAAEIRKTLSLENVVKQWLELVE